MNYNPNKTVSAGSRTMIVSYCDSKKHRSMAYESDLGEIQVYGNKHKGESVQHIGTGQSDHEFQKKYRLALYGLSGCTPEEISAMSFVEQRDITKLQSKVQIVLNKFKEEVVHHKIGSFLSTFFSKSSLAKALANYEDYIDEKNKNTFQFKELGITKEMIINRLVEANLLPSPKKV